MTRQLCMELLIFFSALEVMVTMLQYHETRIRWVLQIFTKSGKDPACKFFQDLSNKYEAGLSWAMW